LDVAVHDRIPAYQLNLQVVEVAVSRSPLMHPWNTQRAARAGVRCDLRSLGVPQDHLCLDVVGRFRLDRVADDPVLAVEIGGDRDICDVSWIGGVEPNGAVDSGVVEEIVPVALALTSRSDFDDARWDRLPMQRVVDQRCNPYLLSGRDMVGDIGLERGVAALVRHHLHVVDPDRGAVCCRLEVEHNASSLPATRDPGSRLVPDVAEVVADGRLDCDVIEARWHSRLAGIGQRPAEPAGGSTLTFRVQPELPQAVQALPLAGAGVLRSQHGGSFALAGWWADVPWNLITIRAPICRWRM
jgi:hypothetical protein